MANRYSALYEEDTKPLGDTADGPQVHKTTSTQVVKTKNLQVHKSTKPLVEKYTTHLPPDIIKQIKMRAIQEERSDYEIVLDAVQNYLKTSK
jgi:hypothetical protein